MPNTANTPKNAQAMTASVLLQPLWQYASSTTRRPVNRFNRRLITIRTNREMPKAIKKLIYSLKNRAIAIQNTNCTSITFRKKESRKKCFFRRRALHCSHFRQKPSRSHRFGNNKHLNAIVSFKQLGHVRKWVPF